MLLNGTKELLQAQALWVVMLLKVQIHDTRIESSDFLYCSLLMLAVAARLFDIFGFWTIFHPGLDVAVEGFS